MNAVTSATIGVRKTSLEKPNDINITLEVTATPRLRKDGGRRGANTIIKSSKAPTTSETVTAPTTTNTGNTLKTPESLKSNATIGGRRDANNIIKSSKAPTTNQTATAPTTTDTGNAVKTSDWFKSDATIVTAFYQGPSMHNLSKYEEWAANLFSLQDPIIIFTTPSFAPFVQKHREVHNAMHKTMIVLLDLNETDTVNMFDLDFWKEQHAKDPSSRKNKHKSFHVYWVWLSKLEFVKRAIEMNPFRSDFFAWVDVGYFRTKTWLEKRFLQHIPNALQQDQVLMLDHHHNGHVGAGFIGGYTKGLLHFTEVFYDNLKQQQHKEFIGREEPMLDEACLVEQNLCLLAAPGKKYERRWVYMAPFLILGQKETESLVYIPTVATNQVQRDMVNTRNVIKPPNVTRNVLMVVAHPDDEVLFGGEYLVKEGRNVHVVVTSTLNRHTSTRYDEFRALQKHLGYHGEFLDGKDSMGVTKTGLESHIRQRIHTLVCGKDWERIITHGPEGEYGHPHHQMVHDAVMDAVKMCCCSSDKLFVFEPHPWKNNTFSEAKQEAAKLYKSQDKIIFGTYGKWQEKIVPFKDYNYEAASKSCRDSRDPKKTTYAFRQCRLHELFDFSSLNFTNALSLQTFSGQGSGC